MSGRRIYLNIRHKISCLLNPSLCQGCGIPIRSTEYYCKTCLRSFTFVPNPCDLCGMPNPVNGPVCPSCLHQPPRWQHMLAPLIFGHRVRSLIHDLKFNEQLHNANTLLTHFGHYYQDRPVEVLLPVPLHRSRLLERGYNQSDEIGRVLAGQLGLPFDRISLQRIRATESQSGLSLSRRQKNLVKAFAYSAQRQYRSAAVIDDVITSGSTMAEISKLLRSHGVEHIEVWSLARALKHDE
jgi:ComF family protein